MVDSKQMAGILKLAKLFEEYSLAGQALFIKCCGTKVPGIMCKECRAWWDLLNRKDTEEPLEK